MNKLRTPRSRQLQTSPIKKPFGQSLPLNPCLDNEACQMEARALGHCFNSSGIETNNQGQGEELGIEAESGPHAGTRLHKQSFRAELVFLRATMRWCRGNDG